MNQAAKLYDNVSVKKLDKSQVEITASIPVHAWEGFRKEALKNLNNEVTIDGFRKGNIPENVLVARVGEMTIMEEIAELAITRAYAEILIDEKIDAIGKPRIGVTKIAKGNPLEFRATIVVVPEIKLPDYKKLANEQMKKAGNADVSVSEADIAEATLRIRKMHVSHEGHDHEKMTREEHDKAISENLPELTDDFVKKIGNFSDVPDFKIKLSAMLAEDKKAAAKEKTRISIADAIAAETTAEMPELMIQSELGRTEAQFTADIGRMGVKFEDYLKHAKKSIDDVRKEWIPHAEKKAKLQLILNEIARLENIRPSAAEIETEVSHIVEHYKDADRERASVYAETVLTNEKVFEFLENQRMN